MGAGQGSGGKRSRGRWVAGAAVALAAPALFALATLGPAGTVRFLFDDNFMPVVPGAIYRSAQPSAARLEEWIASYGLRTVVNLRGNTRGRAWYRVERAVAERHGAAHFTVRLNAARLPGRSELRELVRILDTARRPLLLHCEGGVERAGLASAVALLLEGEGVAVARAQFAPDKGFVQGLHSRPSLGDLLGRSDLPTLLDQYAAWLEVRAQAHSPTLFRYWVDEIYAPYFYRAELTVAGGDNPVRIPKTLDVSITNRSVEPIPFRAKAIPGVRLGAQLIRLDPLGGDGDDGAVFREFRGRLVDRDLRPGETLELPLPIPELPAGRYRLVVDLVNEQVKWFGQMGSPPLELLVVSAPTSER